MLWIGLTGGIATGKTTAAEILRARGYPVVSADGIARQVVEPGEEGARALLSLLGPAYFDRGGALLRDKLAAYIFSDSQRRQEVESVLHPLIQARVQREKQQLLGQGAQVAFYDVPLLFEKNLEDRFDKVLLIYAAESLQRERLQQRESWTADQIEARLAAQIPIDQKRQRADYVIDNSGTLEELEQALEEFLKELKVQ